MKVLFQTLQALIDYCASVSLPLDDMRFALGENKGHSPRWFYIYQDPATGEWVVAKNKSDGSTVERYRGANEREAVQLLVEKMEAEANARGLTIYVEEMQEEHQPAPQPIERSEPEYRYEPLQDDPWVINKRGNMEHRLRRRHHYYNLVMLMLAIMGAVIVVTFLYVEGKKAAFRTPTDRSELGQRPVYSENTEIAPPPDDGLFWLWYLNPSYQGDVYDPGYDYSYDYGYDYGNDYGQDDSWSWDFGDSDWDSGWDDGGSLWDSWDSGSTDWNSDW